MKKSDLERVMMERLKARYPDGEFRAVFTRPKDGCYPNAYFGKDEIENLIEQMFANYFSTIAQTLLENEGLSGVARVSVDPSWEDASEFSVIYENCVLYEGHQKAWHFEFNGLRELKESMLSVYQNMATALETYRDEMVCV